MEIEGSLISTLIIKKSIFLFMFSNSFIIFFSHLVDVEVAEGAAVAVEEDAEEPEAVEPKLSSSRTDTVAFSLPRERNTF